MYITLSLKLNSKHIPAIIPVTNLPQVKKCVTIILVVFENTLYVSGAYCNLANAPKKQSVIIVNKYILVSLKMYLILLHFQ